MLDDAGFADCDIVASNSLDEYIIRDILLQGGEVDSFGVGERLITAESDPVFGGVYKLAAVEEDGQIVPKIKVSENVEKITNPGYKAPWRLFERKSGKAIADVITLADEEIDDSQPYEIFHPEYTWKRKTVTDFVAKKLQVPFLCMANVFTTAHLCRKSNSTVKNRLARCGMKCCALNIPINTILICRLSCGR